MQSMTPEQKELFDRLKETDPDLSFEWDEARGIAAYVRGHLWRRDERKPETVLRAFLKIYGPLFGPRDLDRSVRHMGGQTDDLGWTHLQEQQLVTTKAGDRRERLELYGARLVAHFAPETELREVQSSCWRDVEVENGKRVTPRAVRDALSSELMNAPGSARLQKLRSRKERNFPIVQKPRLVVYPWQGGFRLAWATFAYGVFDEEEPEGEPTGAKKIDLAQVFVDATSGEIILKAPTSMGAETADSGVGLAVTPFGGPFTSRALNIVHVDSGSTYLLKDTTHTREIVTHDAANSDSFNTDGERGSGLNAGTLPVSTDSDGDKSWNLLPTDTSVAQRTASQQPEVDLHFFLRDLFEWYSAIAGPSGRAGWDDGQYPSPPVPPQKVRAIAHVKNGSNPSSINAGMRRDSFAGNWLYWLQFFDGDAATYDYLAGSKFIVGHEYQHAITEFSFKDGTGNPGLTYADWLAAVHEGLSDVFGGLYSEEWLPARDISPLGQIFRNLAFPRDPGPPPPTAAYDAAKFDHFADRNLLTGTGARYDRGDILAHCAYLMGAGGVHRRDARTPALIPVYSCGRETIAGRSVLRAARIWYRALRFYFGTIGSATGVPTNDENTFRNIRNACVSAAQDLYGAGSKEERTTRLAFYAVGLQPSATPYGADVTFLRWGADWWFSKPYVGVSSPDWSSRDLYIKNGPGGAGGWNAVVNVLNPGGNPTNFENDVYCRVRNVGDQQANGITVTFEYAKAGTGPVSWLPVVDKQGNVQSLAIGSLAPGEATFPDADQDSPPASARVKWWIPPLEEGESIDHFCLRAIVSSSNDVNGYNNEVQSNIAYVPYAPGSSGAMAFLAGNPGEEDIPLELRVDASLPDRWKVRVPGARRIKRLRAGQERLLEVIIDMPEGAEGQLEPPFDGDVRAVVHGDVSGPVAGTLTETSWDGARLEGRIALTMENVGTLVGGFDGRVDLGTGVLKGRVAGSLSCLGREAHAPTCVGLEGCLEPWRRVNVSQWVAEEAIGGLTVQVQVPLPDGACARELPPTGTRFEGS
jgi:Zn-dependent metalloprotease